MLRAVAAVHGRSHGGPPQPADRVQLQRAPRPSPAQPGQCQTTADNSNIHTGTTVSARLLDSIVLSSGAAARHYWGKPDVHREAAGRAEGAALAKRAAGGGERDLHPGRTQPRYSVHTEVEGAGQAVPGPAGKQIYSILCNIRWSGKLLLCWLGSIHH